MGMVEAFNALPWQHETIQIMVGSRYTLLSGYVEKFQSGGSQMDTNGWKDRHKERRSVYLVCGENSRNHIATHVDFPHSL